MKSTYIFGKKLGFGLLLFFSISLLGIFSSCKEREEDPNETLNVQFKVNTLEDVKMKAIVTQVGTVQNEKFFDPSLPETPASWVSEPMIVNTKQGAVHLSATGTGKKTDSQLIVSIWINGEKKAVDTAKGINLVAKTFVDFKK